MNAKGYSQLKPCQWRAQLVRNVTNQAILIRYEVLNLRLPSD